MEAIEIRVLDAPAVVVAGEVREVARRREQAVLARLALAAPRTVPIDVIVADVWGDDPPPSAVDALRVHVSNLRKLLGGAARPPTEVLRTARRGYRLDVPEEAVDASRLERACRSGEPDLLRALVSVWPDEDLDRFDSGTGFFAGAARRLVDLRLRAVECVVAADLAAGDAPFAVIPLEEALARAPHHERLWELLVRALSAADRRTDAGRASRRARAALAEVGMEPGASFLSAEAAIFAEAPAGPPGEPSSDYVDVEGSRVAFATVGGGPTDLLLLHGGFVPFAVMREAPRLARFLDALASRYRVLLVDRRGIGMSDGPSDGAPVSVDHWVADCRAVLATAGSRRAVVFAHENAGPVGIRLAAELPEVVAGLVLHATAAKPLRSRDHPFGPSEEALERVDRMIMSRPGSDDMLGLAAPSAGEDPALRAWLERAGRLGAGPARARELHRTYLFADVRSVLGDVRVPCAVLHPARMIRTDPGQARHLAEHLPDAELQLLDSGDLLFWMADADAVLAAIDRVAARATARADAAGPERRLRAILAIAPPVDPMDLAGFGAEACAQVDGALVAVFSSLDAARAASGALAGRHPEGGIAVEVADTSGTPEDPAVRRAAAAAVAASRAPGPSARPRGPDAAPAPR